MELKREFNIDMEIPQEFEEMSTIFPQLLSEISKEGREAVIIIDALNQLDNSYNSHQLDWLPKSLPQRIHIIVSCLHG